VRAGAVLRWGQGAQAPPVAAQVPQFPLILFPDGLRAAIGWGPGPQNFWARTAPVCVTPLTFVKFRAIADLPAAFRISLDSMEDCLTRVNSLLFSLWNK
jgi:hypothetical protein